MSKTIVLIGILVCLAGCSTMTMEPLAETVKTREQSRGTLSAFEAPVPLWQPGYTWEFRWESPQGRGTFVWTITREEILDGVEHYVMAVGRQRESYWRKADLAFSMEKVEGDVEVRAVPPELRYVWPLVPGRRWEQTYTREAPRDKQTEEIARVCQVEAEETITVPAGAFRALKIVCHNQRTGSLIYEAWYAPEVKHWIRERGRFPYGIRVRELLNFRAE